jgi:DNA-binding transcriptional LysR family regulator
VDLRTLTTFCAAARLRSITKAAGYLDLGQPTATTHIKKLEAELGVPLFDRLKRPIQLTPAGTALYQGASTLVDSVSNLVADIQGERFATNITVAATADIISHKLMAVVRSFRTSHPSARVYFRSRQREEALELVESGAVDFGLIPGVVGKPALDVEALFPYERALITPLRHPLLDKEIVTLEDIASWPLVLMPPFTYTRGLLEAEFQRRGLRYDIVLELDSMDMIKRYVSLDLGISVGPALALDPGDEQNLGVIGLSHLLPVEQVSIVTLKGRYSAPPVREFSEALHRELLIA